jgi:hypothetical protein
MDRKALALPTNRGLKTKTLESLMRLTALSQPHILISTKGFNTAENRTWLTVQAINANCTHILFVDDDMIYPEDTLEKLLAHDKDIIGGLYKTRYENPEYLIENKREDGTCDALGGGCLLVKTSVFRIIKQPWFNYEYHENGMVKMSNDWWFCRQARNAGFKIHYDESLDIKHISEHEY